MTWLVAGLIVFLGVHAFSVLRGARKHFVANLGGELAYKGVYALLALIGLVLIVIGFAEYRQGGMISVWNPPAWGRHIAMLAMLISFVSLVATYVPTHIRSTLKHPMIIAVILWALSHLLVNGDLGSIALFGSFLVWGIVAHLSMGRRTKFIFAALPLGPPLGIRNDIIVVAIGVLLYVAALIWLHPLFIGVPVVAV